MYLCDPLWLKVFKQLLEFRAVFSGEWQQRLAWIANRDAKQFTSHFDLLGVAAAFQVAKEREEFVHVFAGGDEVIGERGFEDVVMFERSAGGGAANP